MSRLLRRQTESGDLVRRVAETARRKRLFRLGDDVLVAVSGGPDSVALLSLLLALAPSWRLGVRAVHVNHGLRGPESEEDARFVADLCKRLQVEFVCERASLEGLAGRPGGPSLQAFAREVRYATLLRLAGDLGADKIALGHTADDQAETLLMWMLRGAGTGGLAGIPPVRESLFVRPLLEISRTDLLAYLDAQQLEFRTDSSNAKPIYLRNRIRHDLLPTLKRFNPAIVEVLTRQAAILREEDACLEQWVTEHLARAVTEHAEGEVEVERAGLLALPVALQRRVIRALIRRVSGDIKGPTFGAVASVLDRVVQGRSGSSIRVHRAEITRVYDRIRFGPARRPSEPAGRPTFNVPIPSAVVWPLTGQTIRVSLESPPAAEFPIGPDVAILDADRFTCELLLRTWKSGDVFCPSGMGGRRKKLQDYFTDIKLPRAQRKRVPLLAAPEGILWVVGYRSDHRFAVTPSTARTVIARVTAGENAVQRAD